ncbi:unnamed protein product [Pylaiella littoralis]
MGILKEGIAADEKRSEGREVVAGFLSFDLPPRDGTYGEIGCLVPHVAVAKRVGSAKDGRRRERGCTYLWRSLSEAGRWRMLLATSPGPCELRSGNTCCAWIFCTLVFPW